MDGTGQIVELAGRLDGCTAADLVAALSCTSGGGAVGCGSGAVFGDDRVLGVSLDGIWHEPETPLSSMALWEGSVIEIVPAPKSDGGDQALPSEHPQPGSASLRFSSLAGSAAASPSSADVLEREPAFDGRVSADSRQRASGASPQGLLIAVTGGLSAGPGITIVSLQHSSVIGRSADCDMMINDPTVSRRHARIVSYHNGCPVIDDLGSRNGVVVGGRRIDGPTLVPAGASVRLGATCLKWRSAVEDTPGAVSAGLGAAAGRVPFNRPPRRQPPTAPKLLQVPAEPAARSEPEPLSWIGIALPVIVGLVLALVWNPFMAVFAVLGPLLTIGTWLERRRRLDKAYQQECGDVAAEVDRFAAALPAARSMESRRRMSLSPDPAEIVRRACALSVRCWERRLDDPDAMRFGIGTANVTWTPPLQIAGGRSRGEAVVANAALHALAEVGELEDVPVAVSLKAGEVLGIVGPESAVRSVARCLVLQAAVLHGPADLAVVGLVSSSRAPPARGSGIHGSSTAHEMDSPPLALKDSALKPSFDSPRAGQTSSLSRFLTASPQSDGGQSEDPWDWMRWLPHTADAGGGVLIATDPAAMASVVDAIKESIETDQAQRVCLLVIDGTEPLAGRSAPGRALLSLDCTAGIVMVSDIHSLPAACTTVVEVRHHAGGLRLFNPRSDVVMEPVLAWGVTAATATDAASHLARLEDPEFNAGRSDLPLNVTLIDLIGIELTPEAVLANWRDARSAVGLVTPIGADASGPVEIDLVADGPHLLVGGTTGSGKSELLRTLVAGLALSADPERLAFVLIDYKGGAAFDRCADMPHVAGMVTDLDDRLAERALVCLESELRYREGRLRDAGVEDLTAFQKRRDSRLATLPSKKTATAAGRWDDPLPRLVVVVDEFATLAADLPEFLDSLVGIAQRGRSLGVHMVLATQRPAGVVTDDIRANTSCRIALRVTDKHDSSDVIGVPDAASIPRRCPGRALARFGPGELIGFQAALSTATTSPSASGLRVSTLDGLDGITPPSESGAGPSSGVWKPV